MATAVVPAALYFSFAVAGLEVDQLVVAAYVGSALLFLQALFYLWSASGCATEHIIEFDVPKQEALGCVYKSFAMAGLEGAQLVVAAYVGSALLFLQVLFYLWSASYCATDRIGYPLPGPLQRRSHGRRHWHVWWVLISCLFPAMAVAVDGVPGAAVALGVLALYFPRC